MTPTNHPLTEDRAAELWDGTPTVGGEWLWHQMDGTMRRRILAAMRAAFDAGREHERTTPTDTHHDPRPWQDCTRKDIRKGDLVETRFGDILRTGVAHHQDADGDWRAKDDRPLTYGDRWPLRRIPAPAEEVALTDEPRLLTDVVLSGGEKIAEATWTGTVLLYTRNPLATHLVVAPSDQIEQWTLDGIRARRDGKHEDGTPRFVKTLDGEA